MSKHSRGWMLLALAATWAAAATGQPVYRCGDSYSQQPCPGGKPVAVEDSRTPAQQAQTTEAVRRQGAAADQLEKERLKQEAKAASAAIPPAKIEEPADQRDRTESAAKAKKPKYFSAVSPKKPGEAGAQKKKTAKTKTKAKAKKTPKKTAD